MTFRPRERCYPGGVPEFFIYALVAPLYSVQTPKEVTITNEGGPESTYEERTRKLRKSRCTGHYSSNVVSV